MTAAVIAPGGKRSDAATLALPVDPLIAGIALALLLCGLVMVGSASLEESVKGYGHPFHYMIRHGAYLGVSVLLAFIAISIPVHVWQRFHTVFLVLSFLLLLAVLIPGVGREVNGATRWIPLGAFSLQGSEFVKLFMLFYLAGYLVRNRDEVEHKLSGLIKPLAVVAMLSALLLAQPDFGAVIVLLVTAFGMIFLGGVPWRFFLPFLVAGGAVIGLIALLQPYRLARLVSFLNPWEYELGSGYQLTQALIAFGRGEWLGLGLGNSIQKLFFLPEPHTDFLFSIFAEELGIVGAALVIGLFALLVIRALMIGLAARKRQLEFHAHLACGIALLLGIQASINLGVNLGLLPTKGLTLPLMSYGGNSLMVSCLMIAILLRVHVESQAADKISVQSGRRKRRARSGASAHG